MNANYDYVNIPDNNRGKIKGKTKTEDLQKYEKTRLKNEQLAKEFGEAMTINLANIQRLEDIKDES